MLQDLITGKEDWNFTLIEDCIGLNGRSLLTSFIAEKLKSNCEVHVVTYDEPCGSLTGEISGFDEKNITYHDGYSDPDGWKFNFEKPGYLSSTQDLLEYFEPIISMDSTTPCLIVIDSLTTLIINNQSVSKIAQTLHRMQTLFQNSGKKLHVLCLLHRDVHEESVAKVMEFVASTTLVLFLNHNNQLGCEIIHTKKNRKVMKENVLFKINEKFEVTQIQESFNTAPKRCGHSTQSDPTAGLTFKLSLEESEKTARSQLVLPYTKQDDSKGKGEIIYELDAADDFDEDDPDDDLNI